MYNIPRVVVQKDHSLATMWRMVMLPNGTIVFTPVVPSCPTKVNERGLGVLGAIVEELD